MRNEYHGENIMDKLTDEQKQHLIEAGQAVTNMSHGIKNIVQTLRSAQDVMDTALDVGDLDRAKRSWTMLKQSIDRIQKLSLDMLTFSKDEPLNRRPCDLNQLIESIVKSIRPQADSQKINITVEFSKDLDPISLDREKMQDAIMNLLLNAIEAVEPESGQVIVRTEVDSRHQQAILHITDNGCGIEDVNVIFKPFYSTKSNIGAGLGLTIARQIVERHGGTLNAQSRAGNGTTFTVKLPIA